MNDLILVGDQAFTPEQWEIEQRRRAKNAARHRERYRTDPAYRQRALERHRRWRAANPDRWREYARKWMAAKRSREAA